MMTSSAAPRSTLPVDSLMPDPEPPAELSLHVQAQGSDDTVSIRRNMPGLRLAPDHLVAKPWISAEMALSPATILRNPATTPSASALREGYNDPFMGSPRELGFGSRQRSASASSASTDEELSGLERLARIYPQQSLEAKSQLTLAGILALPSTWRFHGNDSVMIYAQKMAGPGADTVKRGCKDIENILMHKAPGFPTVRYSETFDILAISPTDWMVSMIEAVSQLQLWPALQSTRAWLPPIGQWHAPKPTYALPRHVSSAAACLDPMMAFSRDYSDSALFWMDHRLSMLERARMTAQQAEQDYANLLCWAVDETEI